ncbi:MAG: ATP-binding protein [Chlamydiae bacterium]|nr:ATP-binding protein [Chlamydiota bacterium]MBI3278170.1 ATP-binding protein [Chlamydiota bacterium]
MFERAIIKYLEKWKDRPDRKPLILRGARQVGKTVSVKLFAEKRFKDLIYLNLEDPDHERLFRSPLSLEEFDKIIQIKFGKILREGETLLFIDEIQNAPFLAKLLRFFYEKRPLLHVIAAGSLLEVKLHKEEISFPVGRVEYAYLYPLNFFEYLEAKKEDRLLHFLNHFSFKENIPEAISQMAEKFFEEYLFVGGMPEVVQHFVEHQNFSDLDRLYHALLTSYAEDTHKYASLAKVKYLVHCLETAPLFAGQCITYENFGGSHFRSREMGEALETLEQAMLLHRAMATHQSSLPLTVKNKKPPKLLFLDVGLVNYRLGLREKLIPFETMNDFYRGKISEQVVGQHLLSLDERAQNRMLYWYREHPGSSAEVDFVIVAQGKIIPIEVKSGKTGRLRSLKEFVKQSGIKKTVRVYRGPFRIEEVSIEGVNFKLISLPFYLLPRIRECCENV